MASFAELVVLLLIILSVGFEIAFVPWYLVMLAIMWQTIRTADETDHVSIGMFGLLALGLLRCGWMIWHLSTTPAATEQLAIGVALDALRAVVTTYFMWHLQLKALLKKWLN